MLGLPFPAHSLAGDAQPPRLPFSPTPPHCLPPPPPNSTPPPLKKRKLKLTFHLPHKYFWQALLAFRLTSLGETGPAESLHLRLLLAPTLGTRGTAVVWAGLVPAVKKQGAPPGQSWGPWQHRWVAWPWGCHRVGIGFAPKPGLCPSFPLLSAATSLPNAWFSSPLNTPGQGREGV